MAKRGIKLREIDYSFEELLLDMENDEFKVSDNTLRKKIARFLEEYHVKEEYIRRGDDKSDYCFSVDWYELFLLVMEEEIFNPTSKAQYPYKNKTATEVYAYYEKMIKKIEGLPKHIKYHIYRHKDYYNHMHIYRNIKVLVEKITQLMAANMIITQYDLGRMMGQTSIDIDKLLNKIIEQHEHNVKLGIGNQNALYQMGVSRAEVEAIRPYVQINSLEGILKELLSQYIFVTRDSRQEIEDYELFKQRNVMNIKDDVGDLRKQYKEEIATLKYSFDENDYTRYIEILYPQEREKYKDLRKEADERILEGKELEDCRDLFVHPIDSELQKQKEYMKYLMRKKEAIKRATSQGEMKKIFYQDSQTKRDLKNNAFYAQINKEKQYYEDIVESLVGRMIIPAIEKKS